MRFLCESETLGLQAEHSPMPECAGMSLESPGRRSAGRAAIPLTRESGWAWKARQLALCDRSTFASAWYRRKDSI
jgi:hypothetical protein